MSENKYIYQGIEKECLKFLESMGSESWKDEQIDAMKTAFYCGAMIAELSIVKISREHKDKSSQLLNEMHEEINRLMKIQCDKTVMWEQYHKKQTWDAYYKED